MKSIQSKFIKRRKGWVKEETYGCFIFQLFSAGHVKSGTFDHRASYNGGHFRKRMDGCTERDCHLYCHKVYAGEACNYDERCL